LEGNRSAHSVVGVLRNRIRHVFASVLGGSHAHRTSASDAARCVVADDCAAEAHGSCWWRFERAISSPAAIVTKRVRAVLMKAAHTWHKLLLYIRVIIQGKSKINQLFVFLSHTWSCIESVTLPGIWRSLTRETCNILLLVHLLQVLLMQV